MADTEASVGCSRPVLATETFEATPYTDDTYAIHWKGTDKPVTGSVFPDEVIRHVLVALEIGHHAGASAALRQISSSLKHDLSEALERTRRLYTIGTVVVREKKQKPEDP